MSLEENLKLDFYDPENLNHLTKEVIYFKRYLKIKNKSLILLTL